VSRYDLQWMVVLNCVVIGLFGFVYAIDLDGSVFGGLFIVAAMGWQIWAATRPERQPEAVPQDDDGQP
jgi:hypothetical protein